MYIRAPFVKPAINVGGLMDIPTGKYVTGLRGENILNGGLAQTTGVAGPPNIGKTTLLHHMFLSAADRISSAKLNRETDAEGSTYCTESTTEEGRIYDLSQKYENFKGRNILSEDPEEGIWIVTSKSIYSGNKWFEANKDYLESRRKKAKILLRDSPFPDRDGKTLFKMLVPSFSQVDSFTEFETDDVLKAQDKIELGDSKGNVLFARQGISKKRLLMALGPLAEASSHYYGLTAHVGFDIIQGQAPGTPPPPKKMQHLRGYDKIKSVTDEFLYLLGNAWMVNSGIVLHDGSSTRSAKYPKRPGMEFERDTDLNELNVTLLRGKKGLSGFNLRFIVSQMEGLLPSLTEFHYLREYQNNFGFEGNDRNYALDLLPDIKLSRTTVRMKLDENPVLRRAMNITAELAQMRQFWYHLSTDFVCTPKELYHDLQQQGYDWNQLLNTRGWWTLDNDRHSIPFLSTMDLLNMRVGKYRPYWL